MVWFGKQLTKYSITANNTIMRNPPIAGGAM